MFLFSIEGRVLFKMLHNIFSQKESLPYFGFPGLGLNAGVALMNLTRFYFFPTSLLQALKITYLYLYFFQITGFTWGRFHRNIPVYLAKAQVSHVHWVYTYLTKPLNNVNDQIDWILIGWLWSIFVGYFLRNFLPIFFYRWENFATGLSWLWQIRTCWIWWVGAKKCF